MKKVSVDGLLGLNLEEIEIVYRRCRGEKVEDIADDMGIGKSTIWNDRMPRILEMLEVENWKEIERELCIPLRKIIFSVSLLKSCWPHDFREKIEALREETSTAQTAATTNPPTLAEQTTQASIIAETGSLPSDTSASEQVKQTSLESADQAAARPRVPSWIFVAISLLLFCLILAVGIRFAWNRIPQFSPVASETPANTESPTNVATSTMEEALVPNTLVATVETIPITTDTVEPSPAPSQSPTQTSLPTLFHDPFDTGISPEWGMAGNSFNSVDGKLSSLGNLHGVIGDGTWTDYAVEFNIDHYHWSYIETGLRILVRYQDDSNYMALAIKSVNGCDFRWLIVAGGNEKVVPGSETHVSQDYRQCLGLWRIEVDGNRYKVSINFEPKREFVDDTFNSGGVGIFVNQDTTELILDEFKVLPIP
jgi:hypothetical protein